MPRRSGVIPSIGGAALAMGLLVSGPTVRAEPAPGRPLLATGDTVRGLGRIGRLGAGVRAIADDGSVLLDLSLSDRTRGLAWVDGERLRFIWRVADDAGGPAIAAREARASSDGARVLAPGDPDSVTGGFTALYALADGEAHRVLTAGDRTVEGWTITAIFHLGGMANDGSAAVLASLAPPSGSDEGRLYLLAVSSAGARILAGDSPLLDPSRTLRAFAIEPLGALPGGTVLFQARMGEYASGVFRGDATGVEPILTSTERGPSGEALSGVRGLSASSDGEVLVDACAVDSETGQPACKVYRSQRGQWVTVRPASDLGPDGRPSVVTAGSLNARGDVVFDGYRPDAFGSHVLYYPADGAAGVVGGEDYQQRALNNRGQVALRVPSGLARWTDGRLEVLVTPRTNVANGARPLADGIFSSCLADDGRVGVYVAVDGDTGAWLCIDGIGPHVIQRDALAGNDCTFIDGGMVVAASDRVTRSNGRRTTDLLAVGAPLGDGQSVDFIASVAVNPAGALGAIVDAGEHRVLARVDPGGHPLVLDATGGGALDVYEIGAVGIADNGTVLALVYADHDTTAVVAVTPDGTATVPFRDDSPGTRVLGFDVAGNRLLLAVEHYPTDTTMRLLDLDTGEWSDRVPAGVLAPGELDSVVDTSRAGDVLYRTVGESDAYWLLSGDERRQLAVAQNERPVPVALRSANDILFDTDTYTVGAERAVLSSTGDRISGRCVAPQTTSSAHDDDGCAITRAPATGPWPLLGAAVWSALAFAKRRATSRIRR